MKETGEESGRGRKRRRERERDLAYLTKEREYVRVI